jgi:hypothetical protein
MSHKARLLLTTILLAAAAQARVLSYAPYTDHTSMPALQSRTNRHFAIMETTYGRDAFAALPFLLVPSQPGRLVIYDSTGVEEPKSVFPPDGTSAEISFAGVREDDSQLAIAIQSSWKGNLNPTGEPTWFLSVDGGTSWTTAKLPAQIGWANNSSTLPYYNGVDTGGPLARATNAGLRPATHDTPFVISTFLGLYAINRDGSTKLLAGGNSLQILGTDASGSRILYKSASTSVAIADLAGGKTPIVPVGESGGDTLSGWIGSEGDVYVVSGELYTQLPHSLDHYAAGVRTTLVSTDATLVPIPTYDFNGAWIAQSATGQPTTLSRYTPQTGLIRQWSDISGPKIEALHAGVSGKTLLLQADRERNLADQPLFRDPALAVWHVGDPAPRAYDELFLNEQVNKGFVHVDADAIENGTPFVFDSGLAVFNCPNCSPPPISSPAGGSDVLQEWGIVRSSLAQRLVLPGISRSPGALGSYWLSDVTFYNPADTTQKVNVRYVPTGDGPRTADIQQRTVTLAAHEVRLYTDVLSSLFEMQSGGGVFYLTPDGGGVNVTSRTYTQAAKGTYGFGMNGIDVFAAAGPHFPLTFSGAFLGSGYRTNLILTDVSGRGSAAGLQAAGNNGLIVAGQGVAAVAPPLGQQQMNSIAPSLGVSGGGTGALLLQPSAGEVIASVFSIDNITNDPTYFPPDLSTGASRTIPVVGHIDGANGSKFRSDLFIYNSADSVRYISFQINPWEGGQPGYLSLTLLAHEARVIGDVLPTAFQRTGLARLRYSVALNDSSVRVTSRAYTVAANGDENGGTYGFLMPPLNNFQTAGPGDSLEILGTTTDAGVRTNIGLVDITQSTNARNPKVNIAVIDKSGATIDSLDVNIPSAGGMQLNDIFRTRNVPATAGPVLLRITSVDGLIGAYAAVVDNGTNDPTYLPANLASH